MRSKAVSETRFMGLSLFAAAVVITWAAFSYVTLCDRDLALPVMRICNVMTAIAAVVGIAYVYVSANLSYEKELERLHARRDATVLVSLAIDFVATNTLLGTMIDTMNHDVSIVPMMSGPATMAGIVIMATALVTMVVLSRIGKEEKALKRDKKRDSEGRIVRFDGEQPVVTSHDVSKTNAASKATYDATAPVTGEVQSYIPLSQIGITRIGGKPSDITGIRRAMSSVPPSAEKDGNRTSTKPATRVMERVEQPTETTTATSTEKPEIRSRIDWAKIDWSTACGLKPRVREEDVPEVDGVDVDEPATEAQAGRGADKGEKTLGTLLSEAVAQGGIHLPEMPAEDDAETGGMGLAELSAEPAVEPESQSVAADGGVGTETEVISDADAMKAETDGETDMAAGEETDASAEADAIAEAADKISVSRMVPEFLSDIDEEDDFDDDQDGGHDEGEKEPVTPVPARIDVISSDMGMSDGAASHRPFGEEPVADAPSAEAEAAADSVTDRASSLLHTVGGRCSDMIGKVRGWFGRAVPAVGKRLSEAWDSARLFVGEKVPVIRDWFSSLVTRAKEGISSAIDKAKAPSKPAASRPCMRRSDDYADALGKEEKAPVATSVTGKYESVARRTASPSVQQVEYPSVRASRPETSPVAAVADTVETVMPEAPVASIQPPATEVSTETEVPTTWIPERIEEPVEAAESPEAESDESAAVPSEGSVPPFLRQALANSRTKGGDPR